MTHDSDIKDAIGGVAMGAAMAGLSLTLFACAPGQGDANRIDDQGVTATDAVTGDADDGGEVTPDGTVTKGGEKPVATDVTAVIDGVDALRSDGTKLVYRDPSGDSILVFYYEGEAITGQSVYYNYGDEDSAQVAADSMRQAQVEAADESIRGIRIDGTYVAIDYGEAMYAGMTVSDVKTAYAYLEEQA